MSSSYSRLQLVTKDSQAISIPTPIGEMHAFSDVSGISSIGWGTIDHINASGSNMILDWVKKWFDGYFIGDIMEVPPINKSRLSPFASDVITTLLEEVPYGSTISYNDLGILAGYQNSSRAVGNVMAKNSWPILVPCHRVISSDGDVGRYSGKGGWKTKLRLINMEGEFR